MHETNYIVVDIRIGAPGRKHLTQMRRDFQDATARLFLGNGVINRLAHDSSFSISNSQTDEDAGHIQTLLDEALQIPGISFQPKIHALVIDFTWSPPEGIRDPVLILLAEKLIACFKAGQIESCMILLPFVDQPDDKSLLVQRFGRLEKDSPGSRVLILALNGGPIVRPNPAKPYPDMQSKYAEIQKAHQDDPTEELKSKMVRRLGCFWRARRDEPQRFYSYLIDNGDTELGVLLDRWWRDKRPQCDVLLHDTVNMPSMTVAVQTFALRNKLRFARITDVLNNTDIIGTSVASRRACIVLDAVETGDTFIATKRTLESKGWHICPEVLTVIMKGGGMARDVDGHRITCFLPVERDPQDVLEMQRSLHLPESRHDSDSIDQLRSFDIWYMAQQSGWEPEKDVPENIGFPYKTVPVFPKMLEMFGDFVAYKMDMILKNDGLPLDYFIIHADEDGAKSVSSRLRTRLGPALIIVRVPRKYIKQAQARENDWGSVISEIKTSGKAKDEEWLFRLQTIQNAPAIITDVFNASGSTFLSLHALLRHHRIPCQCYFPFVDRDSFDQKKGKYPVKCFSLYSWYGPRKMKKKVQAQ